MTSDRIRTEEHNVGGRKRVLERTTAKNSVKANALSSKDDTRGAPRRLLEGDGVASMCDPKISDRFAAYEFTMNTGCKAR